MEVVCATRVSLLAPAYAMPRRSRPSSAPPLPSERHRSSTPAMRASANWASPERRPCYVLSAAYNASTSQCALSRRSVTVRDVVQLEPLDLPIFTGCSHSRSKANIGSLG
jgi:hypothetical protein